MARALRRKASSATALALLACGGFAGAAFGDGLPIGSLTTSILPTIGATTAISTPSVSLPSTTVPAVTVPPATTAVTTPVATTPTVTTPAVTTPAVTTPPATTPKVTVPVSVSATGPVPPSSTPIAATISTPKASASVSASAPSGTPAVTAHVDTAAPKAAVSATVASTGGGQAQAAASLPAPSAAHGGSGSGSVSASAAAPAPPAVLGSVMSGSGPVAVSVSTAPAAVHAAGPASSFGSAIGPRPAALSALPRLVPFTAPASPGRGAPSAPELRPVPAPPASRSDAVWSTVAKNPGAAAGGIAALLMLAGLGLAGAARSSAFAAACAELSRFPFPRFRVLPCPDDLDARVRASTVASGSTATRPAAGNGAPPPTRHAPAGSVPPLPPLPRIGGVLGAAVAKAPWSIVKAIIVAMLAVVNAFVLGIRWRVGRLQSR